MSEWDPQPVTEAGLLEASFLFHSLALSVLLSVSASHKVNWSGTQLHSRALYVGDSGLIPQINNSNTTTTTTKIS